MANNKAIQILRGSRDYDPSEINNELLDGQPFYSKKNELLYVGDKSKVAETDANGNPTYYITRPVGASWIKPGEGKGSFVSACLEEVDGADYVDENKPIAIGHESIAFGKGNKVYGSRSIATGGLNTSHGFNNATFGSENVNDGYNSLLLGNKNINYNSHSSLILGNSNYHKDSSSTLIAGLSNQIKRDLNSLISGSSNLIGNDNSDSNNNIVSGYSNTVIQSYNIVNGEENYITADYNIISGDNNQSSSSYSYLLGSNLQSTKNNHKTVTGYYNLDADNTLFEIGNGNSSSGKNAFSVNTTGDAFVQNRLNVGREDSGDPDASLFVADATGACLLKLTPNDTTLNPTESGYQFSMYREASSPEDDDFIIENSTQDFVIAKSGLLADDRNLTNYRYAEFGSGDGLEQVSLGHNVTTTRLGYDEYTSIGNGTFRTFGIYSNASNGKYMLLGYWDSGKPIDNIYLTATDQFNFNLTGSDKFNISKNTVTSKVPFVSSNITSDGSVSVGADLILTNSSLISFRYLGEDNITQKESKIYHNGGTIYTNSDNLIINSPVEVRGSLVCNTAPGDDTSVIRKRDLYINGGIVPEYSYDRRSRLIWHHKSGTNELTWDKKDPNMTDVTNFADIDSFLQPGIYKVMSDIAAQQILHLPEPYAGVLEVHFGAKDLDDGYAWAYPIQDYMTVNGKATYRRYAILKSGEGTFNSWGPWCKISTMTALSGYDDTKGTIESRLTALGFKSGVITFAGTSYGSESYTSTENNGIYRLGNYVFCNIVISNKNIKLQENMFGSIPSLFRPKKDTYITVYAAKTALSSATIMASAIFKIKTTGLVELVTAVGDPLAEWSVYGLSYTYINFGYEALSSNVEINPSGYGYFIKVEKQSDSFFNCYFNSDSGQPKSVIWSDETWTNITHVSGQQYYVRFRRSGVGSYEYPQVGDPIILNF